MKRHVTRQVIKPMKKLLLLIGGPKCGTTSLSRWLDSIEPFCLHPQKEPGHFRSGERRFIKDAHKEEITFLPRLSDQEYIRQFDVTKRFSILVDASTDYLSDHESPQLVKSFAIRHGFELFVVIVLRDPIERAYSEYLHTIRDGLEISSFQESLRLEPQRIERGFQPLFFHARRSKYYSDVKRWTSAFPERAVIISFADIQDTLKLSEKLKGFLGHDGLRANPVPHHNKSSSGSRFPGHFPNLSRFISLTRRVSPELAIAWEKKLSRRLWRKFRLTEADKLSAFERLRTDIERCIADPTFPTNDWHTSLGFLKKDPF